MTLIITSFSSVLLSAIISVRATSALSPMRFAPPAAVKDPIGIKEPEEKGGRDPFIAIDERVVLDHKVQKMRGFFFDARIEVLAFEGLIYAAEGPF